MSGAIDRAVSRFERRKPRVTIGLPP